MQIKALPTKLFLHLDSTGDWANFTVFTTDMRGEDGVNRLPAYPFVCEIHAGYGQGVTSESINAQMAEIRLGALRAEAGELQAKLDAKKEQIASLLAIGHEAPHTANVTAGPDGRIVVDGFDDDIPF